MDPIIGSLTASGSIVSALVKGFKSAVIQVTGTFVGTITFEASVDGVSWTAVQAFLETTSALSSTTTATGIFIVPNPGYGWVRARMSAYTSGTAGVGILGGDQTANPADARSVGNFLQRSGTTLSPTTSGDGIAFDAATITALTSTTQTTATARATGSSSVGGTGVAGAAAVETKLTKAVTAFSDTVAKDVFTVTVPNAAHAAMIELDLLGVLGAGGAVGAGESTCLSKYQLVLARTAGKATVATLSSAIGGCKAKVAGADDITSVVATASAMTGAVGATQTFTVQVAITRSGAGADNHTLVASARILNQNASGVTIA